MLDLYRRAGAEGCRRLFLGVCLAFAFVAGAFLPVRAGEPPKPGELLQQMPIEGAPAGAAAWRVRYASRDEKGAPIEVTGIVIVPAGSAPAKGRDIVSWGRGTVGLAPVCAPSKVPKTMFEKTPGVPDMLKRGYIIAASDFADPDSSRVHPYLVGLAEGRAMLDAVRAAQQVKDAAAGKRYVLSGESEGAHAALWAAKLAPSYAPELDLAGIAAAAPPSDLVANFDGIKNPAVRALMTGYVSDSWSKVYGIPLSTFANAPGRAIIRSLAKDCTRFDVASAFTNVSLLILSRQVPNGLGEPWTTRLKENSLKPWHFTAPLLLAQGGEDDVVLPELTRKLAVESCRVGDDVGYIYQPKSGHLNIAANVSSQTIDWIAARFAGKAAASDCGALGAKAADNAHAGDTHSVAE